MTKGLNTSRPTTAYQRWKERRRLTKADTEELYLNPLEEISGQEVRVGTQLALNLPGWDELEFEINEISEVRRLVGDEEFPFVDYQLFARDIQDNTYDYVLRFYPLEKPDVHGKRTHQVLLIQKILDHPYDEDISALLREDNVYEFEELDPESGDTCLVSISSRVEDVDTPYECKVHTLKDLDRNGKVDRDEVRLSEMDLWDFLEVTTDTDTGEIVQEYFFVTEGNEDGLTELFRGTEIDETLVNVLGRA